MSLLNLLCLLITMSLDYDIYQPVIEVAEVLFLPLAQAVYGQ